MRSTRADARPGVVGAFPLVLVAIGLVLLWTSVVAGGWLLDRLLRQRGRLLQRVERLEDRLGHTPPAPGSPSGRRASARGLPVGAPGADFELPDLAGHPFALSRWKGQRVLLIFVHPHCPHSAETLGDLAALPAITDPPSPVLLFVTVGDSAANHRLVGDLAGRVPVLLQERSEVAGLYRVAATPAAYLVDEERRIASPLALGTTAVRSLISFSRSRDGPPTFPRSLAEESRRDFTPLPHVQPPARPPLPVGSPAPDFRLPRADGGELSLADLRGQPALLVFWDPICPACRDLAPDLERLHRDAPDLRVLAVGRGEPDPSSALAVAPAFPLVLQPRRELARAYGAHATPSAVLVDRHGTVASPVAVGAAAVRAVAAAAVDSIRAAP